jgi:membrane-anchored mycosin MYCP
VRTRYPHLATSAVLVACLTVGLSPAAAAAAPSPPAQCGPSFSNALPHQPWPLHRLQPGTAWRMSRGQGVTVAVLDSGVSRAHPKLADQVLPGTDFVKPGGAGDCDDDGHGTLVAGIIAARDSKEAPFYGIAPDARILPVRVLPNSQKSTDPTLPARVSQAIRYAVDAGAKVINMSLVTEGTPEVAAAVAYAVSHDVVIVAAAGNEGGAQQRDQPVYPAAYEGVIGVAGIDQNGKHVATSNVGDYVDVAAPGFAIEGPAPRGRGYVLDQQGGTSFAAAYVSGVAALVRSSAPGLSASDVIRRIELTADPPSEGRNDEVGYGVVNPYRAVATLLDPRGNRAPSITGQLPSTGSGVDPLGSVKRIAVWAFVTGLFLATLLLVSRPVVRRGRERGWRPAPVERTSADPSGSSASDPFTPAMGTVSITSPSVRRTGPPPAAFGPPGYIPPGSGRHAPGRR